MIAFATSLLFGIVGCVAGLVAYGKRRKPGRPISWGEAMVASVLVFILMMLWYGIIPHQWITLADTEWGWRSDRFLVGPGQVFEAGRFLPFTITYVVLRDLIVLAIYGAGLTLHVGLWMHWQNRSKTKAVVVPTTAYGRPLAREGLAAAVARTDANPPMPEFRDDYVLQEVDAAWLSKAVKPKQFIHIDQSECIMCEGCVDICPWKCIHMVAPEAVAETIDVDQPGLDPADEVIFLIDDDVCTRCALCVDRCPTGVIIMGKVGDPDPNGDHHQRTNTYGYGYGMRLG